MRVTTVLSGAPRPQAAGCLVRLQLPPSPSTRAGGGQRPPPPGEGNEKIRDDAQGGKKVLVLAIGAQPPGRARGAPRRAVPHRITPSVHWGLRALAAVTRFRCRRARPTGAGAQGILQGAPSGGSIELPGAVGRRPGFGSGPSLSPTWGLGLPRWSPAGPPTGGGPGSCGWRPPPAPGSSQRWMWPLGSPVGSSSLLVLRARERAGLVWAWTALGPAGLPPS